MATTYNPYETPAFMTAMDSLNGIQATLKSLSAITAQLPRFDDIAATWERNSAVLEQLDAVSKMRSNVLDSCARSLLEVSNIRKIVDDTLHADDGYKRIISLQNTLLQQQSFALQSMQNLTRVAEQIIGLEKANVFNMIPEGMNSFFETYKKLMSHVEITFPDSSFQFDDIDFSVNEDGSVSIEGETYTSEEICEKAREQTKAINDNSYLGSVTIEDYKKNFKIVQLVVKILVILLNIYGYSDACREIYQTVVTQYNGWENLYYIGNENGATIYKDPSTESPVITRATYSNIVLKTEDRKMWVKARCQVRDEEIEGWIAKRNLIPYADVQFDSDEAVCGQ